MGKGSGLSRSERRRNARKEHLRALLPRDGAVVGIDLGEAKQALAVIDHDVRVVWRKTASSGIKLLMSGFRHAPCGSPRPCRRDRV